MLASIPNAGPDPHKAVAESAVPIRDKRAAIEQALVHGVQQIEQRHDRATGSQSIFSGRRRAHWTRAAKSLGVFRERCRSRPSRLHAQSDRLGAPDPAHRRRQRRRRGPPLLQELTPRSCARLHAGARSPESSSAGSSWLQLLERARAMPLGDAVRSPRELRERSGGGQKKPTPTVNSFRCADQPPVATNRIKWSSD